jgi:hypothetical protein
MRFDGYHERGLVGRPAPSFPSFFTALVGNKMGSDQMRGSGSPAVALDLFEDELCLRRRLFEVDSSDTRLQADVSWSLDRVSSARAKLGDLPGAELALIEAIGLREGLHNRDPKIEWLRDLDCSLAAQQRGVQGLVRNCGLQASALRSPWRPG